MGSRRSTYAALIFMHATVTGGRRAPRRAAGGRTPRRVANRRTTRRALSSINGHTTYLYSETFLQCAMGERSYGGSPNAEAGNVDAKHVVYQNCRHNSFLRRGRWAWL
jgi:hypothetical protein